MNAAIQFNHVCKEYENFSLKDVSFEVPQGFITGFIGPNGAGKTTCIKTMLSLIAPDRGEVEVLGVPVQQNPAYVSAIGVVMDAVMYVNDWRISDLRSILARQYRTWEDAVFTEHLRRFRLQENVKIKDLSRGMKVKLMIAAALSHHARLLVLDEPTSGLDPAARREICELLQDFVSDEEHSVLYSTHITSDLESVADYVILIIDGEIRFSGVKDGLQGSYCVVRGSAAQLEALGSSERIGYRKTAVNAEALVSRETIERAAGLDSDVIVEAATMDDILIFMGRGGAPCAE